MFWRENKLTKEWVINYFKDYDWRTEKESYKYLMWLKSEEIKEIIYANTDYIDFFKNTISQDNIFDIDE